MRRHHMFVLLCSASACSAGAPRDDPGAESLAGTIAVNVRDPCLRAADGLYCGSSPEGHFAGGDPNMLFACEGGMTVGARPCAVCVVEPFGTPDRCFPAGDPCAGVPDGFYCGDSPQAHRGGDALVLYRCKNGFVTGGEVCLGGRCIVEPPGVPDRCSPDDSNPVSLFGP